MNKKHLEIIKQLLYNIHKETALMEKPDENDPLFNWEAINKRRYQAERELAGYVPMLLEEIEKLHNPPQEAKEVYFEDEGGKIIAFTVGTPDAGQRCTLCRQVITYDSFDHQDADYVYWKCQHCGHEWKYSRR